MAMNHGARSQEPEKRYVAVDVHTETDGTMTPQRVYWKDGRVFEIVESTSLGADSHEYLDLCYRSGSGEGRTSPVSGWTRCAAGTSRRSQRSRISRKARKA